jgi:hypothetical protein
MRKSDTTTLLLLAVIAVGIYLMTRKPAGLTSAQDAALPAPAAPITVGDPMTSQPITIQQSMV